MQPSPISSPTPSVPPAPPVASFSWNQTGDLTFDFTNASSGDTSWAWDFGDGTTSIAQNPVHVYGGSTPCGGTNSCPVTLIATGPGGSNSVTHTVDVSPLPTPTP